jgi:hypothetical protein
MIKHRLRRIESFLQHCELRGSAPLPPRRLQTVQDVIDLLHEQVEAVRAQAWAGTIEKARAIAYLAGVARQAIETGVLATRLEMLERVLEARPEDRRR